MASFIVYNIEGTKVEEVKQPALFSTLVDEKLIHRYLTWVRNSLRHTIAHTKTRGEVRGGGRKPWKQKGTGRARVGSSRSPLWRKGGITFGPLSTQTWATRMNRGERRKALFSALSAKAIDKNVIVLDQLAIEIPKTKEIIKLIKNLSLDTKKVLLINSSYDKPIFKSADNLPKVDAKTIGNTNIIDILNHDVLLLTKDSLANLETHFTSEV